MSFYARSVDSKFFIDKRDVKDVLEALYDNDYGVDIVSEEGEGFSSSSYNDDKFERLSDLHRDYEHEERLDKLYDVFADYGWFLEKDENGNVDGISRGYGDYNEATGLFETIAKFVAKGSFVEMSGEDGSMWRFCFDGQRCNEVQPQIVWPDDKYKIAKEVEFEDFKNALECLDYDPDDYTEEELKEMFETHYDALGNDDVYNAIYNETLEEVVKQHQKGKSVDELISDAVQTCEEVNSKNGVKEGVGCELSVAEFE